MVSIDAGDALTLADSDNWSLVGSLSYGGQSYNIYDHSNLAAQLLINADLTL